MPSKLLTLLALVAIATTGAAQPYWSDDFEAYVPGPLCFQDPATVPGSTCTNYMAPPFSGGWTGWFDNTTEAGVVAAGAGHNGSAQYLDITDNDPCQPFWVNATSGSGAASGAPYHPAWGGTGTYPTSGAWTLSAYFRVPSGGLGAINPATGGAAQGYFIVNNLFDNVGNATEWSIQNAMVDDPANPGNAYFMRDDFSGATANGLQYDMWYEIRCAICLDANAISMTIYDATGAAIGGGPFSSRAYETNAGPTEIQNIDLYSSNLAVVHFDDLVLDVGPCGPFEYQFNRPGESDLVLDGLTGIDVFNGGASSWGYAAGLGSGLASNHQLDIDAGGAPADILITPLSGVTARSATTGTTGLINTIFGDNTLNVNFDSPGAFFFYGGIAISPSPTPAIPFSFNAAVIPPGESSAQLAAISATNADGWALSGAVNIATVGTIGFLDGTNTLDFESFEPATGWDEATQAYGANYQTAATATGTWTVRSGGTPSGGTGPTGAYDGTQYVYTEVSGGANVNDFILEMIAPISGPGATMAHYKLHLNGTATGTFSLEEYDPGMAAWVAIDNVTGPLGGNWTAQSAALLFPGAGSSQLRIRYSGATGWSGDCCVDQLTVGF